MALSTSLLDSLRGVGDLGFEAGDAAVLEAEVGVGGLEAFVEGAVVGGELADEKTDAPAGPDIIAPRRPTRVDLTGPGSGTDPELMERLTRKALNGDADQVLADLVRQSEDGINDVVLQLPAQARDGGNAE